MNPVLVVLGTLSAGALGTVMRFMLVRRAPVVGIHGVNVVGTALLAVVVARFNQGAIDWQVAVIVGVGFSGALTTFSSWIVLIDERRKTNAWRTLVLDVVVPIVLSVAVTVGMFVGFGTV